PEPNQRKIHASSTVETHRAERRGGAPEGPPAREEVATSCATGGEGTKGDPHRRGADRAGEGEGPSRHGCSRCSSGAGDGGNPRARCAVASARHACRSASGTALTSSRPAAAPVTYSMRSAPHAPEGTCGSCGPGIVGSH